ncbi:MAG TPA: glycosyltransferase family 39 protein [Candidatus Limnocylindrales bacterium]|nr:glycosyltransferase family 39 protein [Candidatus Limnocylindrales bacterium]
MTGAKSARSRIFGALVLLILAAGAYVRFSGIGLRSVWFDEGQTLGMVQVPIVDLLRHLDNPVLNNQVFYYLALRPWHLLGDDISTVRGFSAICSIVAILLTCLLGRRLFGMAAGLVAGALLSIHWFSIRYAQEARGYSLAMMCSCLAALFLAKALDSGRRRDIAWWVVASGLAMYSHSFALFTIAFQILSLAALGPRALFAKKNLLIGIAAITALTAPILYTLGTASHKVISWIPPVTSQYLIWQTGYLAGGGSGVPYVYVAVLAILVVRILRERDPVARWGATLFILWGLGPLAALATISLWGPVLLNRYLVMSIPAWTLAAGAAVASVRQNRTLAPVAWVLVGVILTSQLKVASGFAEGPHEEDWTTPANLVAQDARPGDAILYDSSWSAFALEYYLKRSGAPQPARLQHGELLFSNEFDKAEASAADRVWLVLSREDIVRAIRIQALLEATHSKVSSKYADEVRIMLYER